MAAKLKYDAEEGDVIDEKKTRNFIQPKNNGTHPHTGTSIDKLEIIRT